MATCPHCGTSSRSDPDALKVREILIARPLGSFSVAGTQAKVSARMEVRLVCRCGWSIHGYVDDEGENFVGYVGTQRFPAP